MKQENSLTNHLSKEAIEFARALGTLLAASLIATQERVPSREAQIPAETADDAAEGRAGLQA